MNINLKIRTKLVLISVSIILASIISVSFVAFQIAKSSIKNARIDELKSVADLMVNKVDNFYKERKADILIAQDYFNIKNNLPILSKLSNQKESPAYVASKMTLDSQLKTFRRAAGYIDVILANETGKIVYVANDNHKDHHLDKQLGVMFKGAFLKSMEVVSFSDIFAGKSHDYDYGMVVSAPVTDFNGKFIGVVALELSLADIYTFIQSRSALGQTGETLIGRKAGDAAMFLNPLRHDKGAALKKKITLGDNIAFPIQESVQGNNGAGISIDYRGKKIIAVWRHIPSFNWGLVAKIDTSEAFASISVLRNKIIVIALSIMLLSFLLSIAFSKSITRPIKRLADIADKISSGDLTQKTDIKSRDEVGALAGSFDKMVDDLQKTTVSRDYVDNIIKSMKNSLIVITLDGVITTVNAATCYLLGYIRDELIGKSIGLILDNSNENAILRDLIKKGAIEIVDTNYYTMQGDPVSVHFSSSLMADHNGKAQGIVCVAQDTRERARMAMEIENLAKFPNENPNPVIRVSKTGDVMYANTASQPVLEEWGCFESRILPPDLVKIVADVIDSEKKVEKEFACGDKVFALTLAPVKAGNYLNMYGLDITLRKQAEDGLRKSEGRLAGVLGIAEDAVVSIDEAQNIIIFNKGAENIFGYSASEILGKPLSLIIPDRFSANHHQHIKNFSKSNVVSKPMGERHYEIIGRMKDGSEFPAEASISQLAEKGGKVFTAVLRNISERKKSERILNDRRVVAELASDINAAFTQNYTLDEMLFSCTGAIVNHLGAAFARIWSYNKDKEVLELMASSGIYTHINGAHKNVPIGKFKIGLVAQDRRAYVTNNVIGDKKVHDQEWAKRENMVSFAGLPLIVAGRLIGVLAMFSREKLTDIVLAALDQMSNLIALGIERKQADNNLRKLTTAVEQSAGLFTITNVKGEIEYVNPKFTKVTGYTLSDCVGKNPNLLKSGKQNADYYKELWSTISSGKEWRGEFLNKTKKGDLYWEFASISPVKDSKNRTTHFVKASEDITENKLAEEELIKYKNNLEELVEERNQELKKTYDQLTHSTKLSAIGRLSASIAHEFNNPIFGIKYMLELINRNAGEKESAEETKKFSGMAMRECDRMAELIEKLRDFHRPSSGERAIIDVNKTIDDVILLTTKKLQSKHIKLIKDYSSNLPRITAVPDQIKQVMLNLISNAEQAITDENNGRIKIRTDVLNESVYIHVDDNGSGIKPSDIKNVFDPFFSTKAVKGTGLGLSISYGIVKDHGGEISVKSNLGEGATFTVMLPVKSATAGGLKR